MALYKAIKGSCIKPIGLMIIFESHFRRRIRFVIKTNDEIKLFNPWTPLVCRPDHN